MDIGQYHGRVPDWRRPQFTKAGELFGIELEVEHSSDRQTAADSLDSVVFGEYPTPVVERDGSLNQDTGLEIICPPLPLHEIQDEGGYIARIMNQLRASGVPNQQRNVCGMHVNINVVDWTPTEKLLVQWCLNAFETTVTLVARREPTQYTTFRQMFRYRREVSGTLRLDTYPGSKHSSAWLRAPANNFPAGRGDALVLEARFPRSTLEIKDLHAAIDYVMAVRDWVRQAPNHTQAAILLATVGGLVTVVEALFVRWCIKNRPHVLTTVNTEQERDQLYSLVGRGKRLEVLTRLYEERASSIGIGNAAGFQYDGQAAGFAKQILRISTLVGKGVELEGDAIGDGWGASVVVPSTVRARR